MYIHTLHMHTHIVSRQRSQQQKLPGERLCPFWNRFEHRLVRGLCGTWRKSNINKRWWVVRTTSTRTIFQGIVEKSCSKSEENWCIHPQLFTSSCAYNDVRVRTTRRAIAFDNIRHHRHSALENRIDCLIQEYDSVCVCKTVIQEYVRSSQGALQTKILSGVKLSVLTNRPWWHKPRI